MSREQAHKLGVDFGGVISERSSRNADTSFFSDNYLATPAVIGSFATLAALNENGPFADNIHVVSKCFPRVEEKTRNWLDHHGFHEETGIPVDNLHFSRTREGKADIATELELSDFVDDQPRVLEHMRMSVSGLYLFDPESAYGDEQLPLGIVAVNSWEQVQDQLLRTLEQ